jgi:hypothetical protein
MRPCRCQPGNRQLQDLALLHGGVAQQAPVLQRHLAGTVLELPRRVGEDGRVLAGHLRQQILGGVGLGHAVNLGWHFVFPALYRDDLRRNTNQQQRAWVSHAAMHAIFELSPMRGRLAEFVGYEGVRPAVLERISGPGRLLDQTDLALCRRVIPRHRPNVGVQTFEAFTSFAAVGS